MIGATYARFLFAAPWAVVLVAGLALRDGAVPAPTAAFVAWALVGAVAQIGATLLLLHLFSLRNFAVGNTFARTETVQAALFGLVLLGDRVGALAVAGILVSLVGLVLLSATRGFGGGALNRAAAIGLACGAAFAMAGIGYRAASLALAEGGSFLLRPAFTLAFVTLVQSAMLTVWLWRTGEGGVGAVLKRWRIEALVGVTGMLASLGWFAAFTLVSVAQVKAVGQIELLFSWLTARFAFGERPSGRETAGDGAGRERHRAGDPRVIRSGRFVVMRARTAHVHRRYIPCTGLWSERGRRQSGRGETLTAFEDVQVHVIAHEAFAGPAAGLVVPRGVGAGAQRLVDDAPARLAGAHRGVEGGEVPAGADLGLEAGARRGVGGVGGEVGALVGVGLEVVRSVGAAPSETVIFQRPSRRATIGAIAALGGVLHRHRPAARRRQRGGGGWCRRRARRRCRRRRARRGWAGRRGARPGCRCVRPARRARRASGGRARRGSRKLILNHRPRSPSMSPWSETKRMAVFSAIPQASRTARSSPILASM